MLRSTVQLALALDIIVVNAHRWPNTQLDVLESMRFDLFGYNQHAAQKPLANGLTPCSLTFTPLDTPGQSNAADWIRNVCASTHLHVEIG